MASRFIDTTIWKEDWFCELGSEYQNFWNYITCDSDNAGIWKPNKIDFEIKSRTKINMVAFLQKVNEQGCKERIYVNETGRWFLTGFITFQWFNKKDSFDLVLSNKLHKHIYDLLIKNQIPIEKVRGLKEVLLDLKGKGQVQGVVLEGKKEKLNFEIPLHPVDAFFPIERCTVIAMNDERWVKANKTNQAELHEFNGMLERKGRYDQNPKEYKEYFANWKAKGKIEDNAPAVKKMQI